MSWLSAPHAAFVLAAYGLVGGVLIFFAALTFWRAHQVNKEAKEVELEMRHDS